MTERENKVAEMEILISQGNKKFQFGRNKTSYSIIANSNGILTVQHYGRAGYAINEEMTTIEFAEVLADNEGRIHWTVGA